MAKHFGLPGLTVLTVVTLFAYCDASSETAEQSLKHISPNAQDSVEFVGIANGKAYFRDAANKSVNFAEYIQFCQINKMRTASVTSAEENQVLTNYFSDARFMGLFWLGGWDINHEDEFTWLDSNKAFNYTNWMYDKPESSRYGNCVYMARSGTWVIKNCQDSSGNVVSLCQLSITE